MNFSDALEAMRAGNKVVRELWKGAVSHWQILAEKIVATYPSGAVEVVRSLLAEDVLAQDWWETE